MYGLYICYFMLCESDTTAVQYVILFMKINSITWANKKKKQKNESSYEIKREVCSCIEKIYGKYIIKCVV